MGEMNFFFGRFALMVGVGVGDLTLGRWDRYVYGFNLDDWTQVEGTLSIKTFFPVLKFVVLTMLQTLYTLIPT